MQEYVDPGKVQEIVRLGFVRMTRFCKVRAMLFKSYVSHYYYENYGIEGSEPINLVFNTIRSFVPNLVMQHPVTHVSTRFVQQRQSAELLGLALDEDAKVTGMKQELRAWVTNAMFGWGMMKVGVAAKGDLVQIDNILIDPGQVYATNVPLWDWGFDPACTDINKAKLLFHRTTLPRQWLLDTEGYNHDLVKKLPRTRADMQNDTARMTISDEAKEAVSHMQDEVDIVECYIPEIEALVTMCDPTQGTQPNYLKLGEFNGPKEGPYVPLSFTPPVEGNPFPVAPVSIWYDLARETNAVFCKILEQIRQQKDVGLYNPAQVDTVDQIEEARTGDWVPTMDPKGVNIVSVGGQNQRNEAALGQLQTWYNYLSGNPDQISGKVAPGGQGGGTTATATQVAQSNASIQVEDMRDILYDQTAEVQRRKAWYFWTDPLINMPLTKRVSGGEYVQLYLTPEQRQGDFLSYTFRIKQRSMSRLDPMTRSKRIETFCTNIMPGAFETAIRAIQIGQQFNVVSYLTKIASEWDILDEVDELFVDPNHQQKMAVYMAMGAKDTGQAGTAKGQAANSANPMANGVMTNQQEANAMPQQIAAISQSVNQGAM